MIFITHTGRLKTETTKLQMMWILNKTEKQKQLCKDKVRDKRLDEINDKTTTSAQQTGNHTGEQTGQKRRG